MKRAVSGLAWIAAPALALGMAGCSADEGPGYAPASLSGDTVRDPYAAPAPPRTDEKEPECRQDWDCPALAGCAYEFRCQDGKCVDNRSFPGRSLGIDPTTCEEPKPPPPKPTPPPFRGRPIVVDAGHRPI